MAKPKGRRGGLQDPPGGRRTRYPGKIKAPKTFQLTPAALDKLHAATAEHKASESDIVCNLLLESKVKNLPPLDAAG